MSIRKIVKTKKFLIYLKTVSICFFHMTESGIGTKKYDTWMRSGVSGINLETKTI